MKLFLQIFFGIITGFLVDRYGYSYSTTPALFILQLLPLCVIISIAIHLLLDDTQKS
jgi:hypothetical protein